LFLNNVFTDGWPALQGQQPEENFMKHIGKSGQALAAAAFTLAISGAGVTLPTAAQAADATVHCMGVNSCKGQSDCATAASSCKGMNSCKGQGFLEMTADECTSAGGTYEA
jgi:hypothetical protein